MSIFKSLYDKLHPAKPEAPLSTPETRAEAEEALKKANTDRFEIVRKEDTVNELVEQLRGQLDRNHFGELVEASMRRSA